jgi:nitroreductase/NAD-dependent dihydropyrimidine dehydrogenase PreA subunit
MISLDADLCNDCLDCVSVCPNYVFAAEGPASARVRYPDQCCACGHCIAVCASDALSHPDLPSEQFEPLPPTTIPAEAMKTLLLSRRSIRRYTSDPVPPEAIENLLAAATHAGTSSNGQTEGFVIVTDRAFLKRLELQVVDVLWKAGFKYMGGGELLARVFEAKYGPEIVKQYRTYNGIWRHRREHGDLEGVVFRNAPLLIVAHALKTNALGAVNCALALRNIELLAVTMGLGTCWAGFLVGAASKSRTLGESMGLPRDRQIHGAVMVGHPVERYHYTMPRKTRSVRWIGTPGAGTN